MNCAFHPTSDAAARCANCQRSLCAACDHRIKGSPYCQDCIVAGIERLRHGYNTAPRSTDGPTPLIAGLFALIPGLGAAFNGQNIKALLHFIIPVSLWQLGDIFNRPLELPLFLGGAAFYIFSIYDAVRAARRSKVGEDLRIEDEALKRMLRNHTTTWGAMLVGVGALTLLDIFFPYHVQRYWPFLLIVAGLFLLRNYQQHRHTDSEPHSLPTRPPSVIGAPYERAESNLVNAERRFDHYR